MAPSPRPPLPAQRPDMPWPTEAWPGGAPDPDVDAVRLAAALDRVFAVPAPAGIGETHAVVVVHRGRLVAERYAPPHGPDTTLPSWSMAKSVLHALVGLRVGRGALDLHAPSDVPQWSGPGDPRGAITLDQLLRMVSGLAFEEEYEDPQRSSTIRMLFGEGKQDMAAFAASQPPEHAPGESWSYSSGTSNIVSGIVGRSVGGGREGMLDFMRRELLDRIGMRSAIPRFDAAGTWIGSSFLFDTARDFARFGLLYLRDGVWEGERILPEGWVDYARTPTRASGGEYGAHFWLALDGSGTFSANGYRNQYTVISPERDAVIVRLGHSLPEQKGGVLRFLADVLGAFPDRQGERRVER